MRSLCLLLALLLPSPQQPDPAALFEHGMTWQEFLDGANVQRPTWLQNTSRAAAKSSDELVARLKKVSTGLSILVVADPACSDSVSSVPYLARLAELAAVPLRVVDKPTGTPIMEQHRTPDGRAATPTVVLLRHGKEIGAWIERPSPLQTWYLGAGQALTSQERLARKMAWYDWDRGDTSLAEIIAIAEKSDGLSKTVTSSDPVYR